MADFIDPLKLPEMPELMIAGPGALHDEDLDALSHQVMAHYGDFWTQLHAETIALVTEVLGASEPAYVIPGTGSTCLDAAVMNLFEPGQRVVVADTGFFGRRLAHIAEAQGLEVMVVEVPPGAAINPDHIADVAGDADGILSVHVETATGVRHPIEQIARVAREAGAAYVVDGVASVGGELASVDDMGLDALVTSSQKGLDGPPGLGMLALSQSGRARVEARSKRPLSWYLDLKTWDWFRSEWGAWHPHPVTMPSNLIVALNSSIRRILERGLESWVEDRRKLASKCRERLQELGFELIPPPGCEANLVVAAWCEDPVPILAYLLQEQNIMISGGLPPTQGRAIRVGLMGRTATEEMVEQALSGIEKAISGR
ncbi:MAG TPA: aminotransferase class V-fold PLP-dependent enzyme [Actinomycetota bacterium]|nr:aminotransferase class V-fold PLP-dependent enzyme [Actinomycetota bacterium]